MKLLIDGSLGIYIPKLFVEKYSYMILNKDELKDSIEILKDPDHPEYWYAWDEILNDAEFSGELRLYQDGDLWLVDPDQP